MRSTAGLTLLSACILVLLVAGLPLVHAYDDSMDTNTSQGSTVNPQQLVSLLDQLASNANDTQGLPLSNSTQFHQLLSQLNSSLTSGNGNLTASALQQLRNFTSSSVSPGMLSALVNSLQATGSGGVTVNPSGLGSLLSVGPNGLPNGLGGGTSKEQIAGLASLSSLLEGINPQLAEQLLNLANDLAISSGAQPSSPGLTGGGLGSLSGVKPPSIAAPKLLGPQSTGSVLDQLTLPVLVSAVALVLFAFRGRMARLLKGQRVPGQLEERTEPVDYDPADPKQRILYYFSMATKQMRERGVPKGASETHREFSTKCEGKPGAQQVRTISTLYEKARFSGRTVTGEDADSAQTELSALAKVGEPAHGENS